MTNAADYSWLIDGLPTLAVHIDGNERIAHVNAAASVIVAPSMIGRHHALALRRPEAQAAIRKGLDQGERCSTRYVVQGPSKDTVYTLTVIPVPKGQGIFCLFDDQSAAEDIQSMRRDFVANVSHELRSPLTSMLGFIETLRTSARNDAAARDRFLGIMEREAQRMSRLISDLLHLSRVESQERQRPMDMIQLADICRATITQLKGLAESSAVAVQLNDPGNLPLVRGDGDQVQQVVQNLVENAIKYGKSGGVVTLTLSQAALPKSAAVRLDVSDKGSGIAPEHLPRLTERFYRVDDHRSRAVGGTGLGLAIVKHIMHRHRGRMLVTSDLGKGSTFSVLLPVD